MELNNDGSFTFSLNGKVYHLIFEGNSPRVYYLGEKQIAKRVLREYFLLNKIPINLIGKDKKGNSKELTTHDIGRELLKYLGIKKPKNTSATHQKVKKSSIDKKLKADYRRRVKNGMSNFKSFEEFNDWYTFTEKKCYYCGLSEEDSRFIVMNELLTSKRFPEKGVLKQGKARGYYLEVDKKDPILNYSKDNCVLACYFCNNDKSDVFDGDNYIAFFQNRLSFLEQLIVDFKKNNNK